MMISDLKLALDDMLVDQKPTSARQLIDKLDEIASNPSQINDRSLIYLLRQVYDNDAQILRDQTMRLRGLCDLFFEFYGDGPITLLRAPARINILGEHIDYVSYLPTASLTFGSRERDMLMLYRASTSGLTRGVSSNGEYAPSSFDFHHDSRSLESGNFEADWLSYLYQNPSPAPHWLNYVKGSINFARTKFGKQINLGFDFAIDSTIPAGGGASSSSALVVLSGAAIREVNNICFTLEELARDSSMAEWYVGTRGGAMDHTTICLAQTARGVLINHSSHLTRRVSLPGSQFRWITFFSTPANKGREVMIEYNERAAVSRLLIPALIDGWRNKNQSLLSEWSKSMKFLVTGSSEAMKRVKSLLELLPETLSLEVFQHDYPEAFIECERSFPALVKNRSRWPLRVRARALHHIGEIERVTTATHILDSLDEASSPKDQDSAMHAVGHLLNESHQSLRDLYGVSTSEVEDILRIINSDRGVYGSRLMGGGFGGNVLVLTTKENTLQLIEQVQSNYYEPQRRNGLREGSVMISTPGSGLVQLSLSSVWREVIEQFNSAGRASTDHIIKIQALLDAMHFETDSKGIWPIVVAAGKGTRASASGLQVPKPLAVIGNQPSLVHVLENIAKAVGKTKPPIVIVSPETEAPVREALEGKEVNFVIQPEALGTGDAVLQTAERLRDFGGLALVIWSTQPVIRPRTILRTFKLTKLFSEYEMIVPTTFCERPYAPLKRDEQGRVRSATETHLQGAESIEFGETNIGLFVLKSEKMVEALLDLKQLHWNESTRTYDLPGKELGFPNELMNYLSQRENGVIASPIADHREEQGIKRLEDVAVCERFIYELAQQDKLQA